VLEEVLVIKRSTLIATAIVATAAIVGLAAAPGCSSEDKPAAGGYVSVKPPVRPTAKKTGTTKWYAINALKLGLTKKGTTIADANAWKDYGFDLDSRETTKDMSKSSTNSCKRKAGSPTGVLTDGNGGRDNNFGQHVMSVIKSLKADAEESVTGAITDGSFTLLLKLENFTAEDNSDVKGSVYVANDFAGGSPKFTATETGWQILDASLVDGKTIASPKLSFNGYVAGGYWVSGDFGQGTIELAISLSGAEIKLPIDSGVISFKVADGSDGTIAGAMNTGKLQEALTPVAKRFGICPGNSTFEQVVSTLTSSADLVTGAPNLQDTTKECNAISIALGFTVKEVGDHSGATVKVSKVEPGTDECVDGDAGTDSAPTDTGAGDTASGG